MVNQHGAAFTLVIPIVISSFPTMSIIPTKKDEKEIAKEVAAMESVISNLSYVQLAELLSAKKEQEIEAVTHKLLPPAHFKTKEEKSGKVSYRQ